MKKYIIPAGIVLLVLLSTFTWFLRNAILDISKPYPAAHHLQIEEQQVPQDTVLIGVISRFPSNIIYQGYQPLLDYMSRHSGYRFELMVSQSYLETVQQLASGKVDAAFLGSYIYARSRDEYNLIPILKPLNENLKPFFHSVLIARQESDIHSIKDLAGRKLALPSEDSFSGNWLIHYGLQAHSLDVRDLVEVANFQHHHTVVYEVMRNHFDAGVVKDRVAYEFLDRGVRIAAYSDPVPGSPIVVHRDHDPAVVSAIIDALLSINPEDPAQQDNISSWDPEFAYGFIRAEPEDYDYIIALMRANGVQ